MLTPVEVFDEWLYLCEVHGDRFGDRYHPIPDEFALPFKLQRAEAEKRMKQIKPMILPHRPIEIYTDFVDDGSCNAAADIHRGLGLAGIAKGAVLLMVEMFNRMLTHPGVLEEIGDSKLERVGSQHREGLPSCHNTLIDARRKAGQNLVWKNPFCHIRRDVVDIMIELTQRFIAMHEITHILYGHVGYLRKVHNLTLAHARLSGTSVASSPSRAILDWQTAEISADDAAARVVMAQFVIDPARLGPHVKFRDPKLRLFIWTFALYAMFRLWGLKINPAADLNYLHPPSALRIEILIMYTCYDFAMRVPGIDDHDEYFKIVTDAQAAAEQAIGFCGGQRLVDADVIGLNDPRVRTHLEQICEHHDRVLISELKKYSHVEIRELSDQSSPLPPQPQTPPPGATPAF